MAARLNGGLAQLGEHLPCKQGVESSNLLVSIVEIVDFHSRNIIYSIYSMFLENRIQKLILISKYVKTSEVARRFRIPEQFRIQKSVLVINTSNCKQQTTFYT